MEFGQTGHYGQYMGDDYVKTAWGWNVRYCRPATREETFHKSYEVCQCSSCSTDPHYSTYYCGRLKQAGWMGMLERDYWKHRDEIVSKQEMANKKVRIRGLKRDRNS